MTNNFIPIVRNLKFKIIILNSPYDLMQNCAFTRSMFSKMLKLKLDGYLQNYPHGVLPIDTIDFVSSHLLLCIEEDDGEFTPIVGCKVTSLNDLRPFKLDFPLVELLEKSKAFDQKKAIESIVSEHELGNQVLHYNSSFTMASDSRITKYVKKELFDIFVSIFANFHTSRQFHTVLCLAVPRFRTNRLFESWGFEHMQHLDSFKLECLHGEKVELFKLHVWSEYAMKMANKYQGLWDQRLDLDARVDKALEQVA